MERMNQSGTGVELEGMFTVDQLEQIIMRMKFRQQSREEYVPEPLKAYKASERPPYTPHFSVETAVPIWMMGG